MSPILVAIIGAVSALISSLIAALVVRKKNKADAADVITQAASRAVGTLQEALESANQTVSELREQVKALRIEVSILKEFILVLGGDLNDISQKIERIKNNPDDH